MLIILFKGTLPEICIASLKINGWMMKFPFGSRPFFQAGDDNPLEVFDCTVQKNVAEVKVFFSFHNF